MVFGSDLQGEYSLHGCCIDFNGGYYGYAQIYEAYGYAPPPQDPNIVPDIEDSIVLDEKIHIRCGISGLTSHVHAVVYNPSHGTWQHADADMVLGWHVQLLLWMRLFMC